MHYNGHIYNIKSSYNYCNGKKEVYLIVNKIIALAPSFFFNIAGIDGSAMPNSLAALILK